MAKIFYTERDIEDLAKKGVKSLEVNDEIVLTDLARDKARRLGVELVSERDKASAATETEKETPASKAPAPNPTASDLEQRVYKSVKAKLGEQVDETLLRTIVARVVKSVGRNKHR